MFISTLIVIGIINLTVYLTGIHNHRSLYSNALISTSILAIALFIFISCGLFNGWKLKDTLTSFKTPFSGLNKTAAPALNTPPLDALILMEGDENGAGCFLTVIIWLIVGVFGGIVLWSVGAFFWGLLLASAGLLYWIIFRAFRLIFKNSAACKGQLFRSVQTAFIYSILYVSWIYAIIYTSHHFL